MKKNDTFYTCPYCKEEYTEPGDLARCILSCETRIKAEEEEKRKAKIAAEKEVRKKEVDEAIVKCKELIKAYMHDYGIYSFNSEEDSFFSSKFWNWVM